LGKEDTTQREAVNMGRNTRPCTYHRPELRFEPHLARSTPFRQRCMEGNEACWQANNEAAHAWGPNEDAPCQIEGWKLREACRRAGTCNNLDAISNLEGVNRRVSIRNCKRGVHDIPQRLLILLGQVGLDMVIRIADLGFGIDHIPHG
jgi:hypothetical protein